MPDEFKPFKDTWSAQPFIKYLEGRGIDTHRITRRWGVRYCTRGHFRGRVIFPVYHEGNLVSWTGRTVYKGERRRYMALPHDPDKAARIGMTPAVAPISHFLLWFDAILESGAETLIGVEGPMDALKINLLGWPEIAATCFFTSSPSEQQVALLARLRKRFKRRFIISDAEMPHTALRLVMTRLSHLKFRAVRLPPGVEDPAELSSHTQLRHILLD